MLLPAVSTSFVNSARAPLRDRKDAHPPSAVAGPFVALNIEQVPHELLTPYERNRSGGDVERDDESAEQEMGAAGQAGPVSVGRLHALVELESCESVASAPSDEVRGESLAVARGGEWGASGVRERCHGVEREAERVLCFG